MNATDFNPDNSAEVAARLRTVRNLALDFHDAAVEALNDYQTITAADWKATPPETIREMFELSARLNAARLQVLFQQIDCLIDEIDFAGADEFAEDFRDDD